MSNIKILFISLSFSLFASPSEGLTLLCGENKVPVEAPHIEKYSLTVRGVLEDAPINDSFSYPLKNIKPELMQRLVEMANLIFTDPNAISDDKNDRNKFAKERLAASKTKLDGLYKDRSLLDMVGDYKAIDFLDIPELQLVVTDYIADTITSNDFVTNHFAQNSQTWQEFSHKMHHYMSKYIAQHIQQKDPKKYDVWGNTLTLEGHTGKINSVVFSTYDTTVVVTASDDKTAKIWDAKTGKELHTLTGHGDSVRSAEFGPVNNVIITTSDNCVKMWDAETGILDNTLKGHGDRDFGYIYSFDGKSMLSISPWDNAATVMDTKTSNLLYTLPHDGLIYSAVYGLDRNTIVTASADKTAKIWDVKTGNLLYTLRHDSFVYSVASSLDGKIVASVSGDKDKTAKIWEYFSIENPQTDVILMRLLVDSLEKQSKVLDLTKNSKLYDQEYLAKLFDSFGDEEKQFFIKGHKESFVPLKTENK